MVTLVERLETETPSQELNKEAADMLRRLLRIVEHAYPEKTGSFFICGASPVGDDGLPDAVSICPSYGVGWSATYTRVETVVSEGS
jgi:hypothetical protein